MKRGNYLGRTCYNRKGSCKEMIFFVLRIDPSKESESCLSKLKSFDE